jgi:hypothetical protein
MRMSFEIITVTDQMFPKAPLPDPFIATAGMTFRQVRWRRDMSRKPRFDDAPPFRDLCVSVWQGPDHVQLAG